MRRVAQGVLSAFFVCAVTTEAHADDWVAAPLPVPDPWTQPGNVRLAASLALLVANPGLARARVDDGELGRTRGHAVADWVAVSARQEGGHLEGTLMLNFEALTLPARGWSEIGQSAEGAYDTQPPRQLVDRALIALHLLGREEGAWRAVLWGGRGAATFGGPSYVSRASNPSPSMPRKHHVGEVPDTASPVVGATVEYERSILEGSWFSARTPSLADSHLQPRVHSPRSLALRLRRRFGVPTASFEAQASAAHLVDRGNDLPDAWQLSTSLQAHFVAADFFVDLLLDGAIEPGKMGLPRNEGAALEVALRDHSRRDSLWTRVELIDRIERGGWMSQDWWFVSLGFERVVWCDSDDTLGIGVFGEATVTWIPESKRAELGSAEGATLALGVRGRLLADVRHPSR